jgi:hypothetical protein
MKLIRLLAVPEGSPCNTAVPAVPAMQSFWIRSITGILENIRIAGTGGTPVLRLTLHPS